MWDEAAKMELPIIAILVLVSCSAVESSNISSESVNLVKTIYNFYKPSGIIVVFDAHKMDMAVEKSLFSTIRQFSDDYIMSQVVTYLQLEALVHHTSSYNDEDNEVRWAQPLDPLYMLMIRDEENLAHFMTLSTSLPHEVSTPPWFVYVVNDDEELSYMDCAGPRGNPFNLALDSRVMIKCSNDEYLRRYFSIDGSTTEAVSLDHWTPGRAISARDMKNEYHRSTRTKWHTNFTFRVAQQKSTSVVFNRNPHQFVEEIINELREISVFDFEVVVEEDMLGYRKDNNEWIGLMNIMKERRADVAAALFSMSKTRMLAIDFTIPLLRANCGIYAKLPEFINIHWSAYFDVLGTYAWLSIVLLILLISVVLSLLKKNFRRFAIPAPLFFENVINTCGAFMQQGAAEESMRTTVQILYLSMFLSSIILNAVYSASITSYIAAMTLPTLPFSNYSDFLKDNQYKVVVLNGSRDEDLIKSTDDELMSPLKGRLEKSEFLPSHSYTGFVQACSEKVAFYSNDVDYQGISQDPPCNLGFLVSPRYDFLSLALVKNSPYTGTINYFILRLMNNGIINRLKMQYFYKYTELVENRPKYITLWEIVPILSIWGLGLLSSLIVLFFEVALRRFRCRCRKRIRGNCLNFMLIEKKTVCSSQKRNRVNNLKILLSKKKTG